MWENHSAGTFAGIRASTHDDSGLALNLWNRPAEGFQFIAVSGRSRLVDRTPDLIRRQPLHTVALAVVTHGEAFFHDRSGTQVLRRGDLVLYDVDAPFLLGCSSNMSELMMEMPRTRAEAVLGASLDRAHVVRTREGDARHAHKAALSAAIQQATMQPGTPVRQAGEDLLSLVDLICGAKGSASAEAYLVTARRYIAARLGDAALTPAAIAAGVGISERHLARLVAEQGTTTVRYVREQRLESAAQALAADPVDASVGQLARRFGFPSQAHFTRVFKERFGQTPDRWRRDRMGASSS